MADASLLKAQLEGLLEKVGQLEAGGDLEGLLERETAALKHAVYEAALQQRERQAAQAAFPPCGLSAMPMSDAPLRGAAAPGADAGRSGAV